MGGRAVTAPCDQCPWRRASAPGWLGANTPEGFASAISREVRMPCHTLVDYEREGWEWRQRKAPLCRGALIMMRNTCKLPLDPEIKAALKSVEPDRERVFATVQEFIAHHRSGAVVSWEESNRDRRESGIAQRKNRTRR